MVSPSRIATAFLFVLVTTVTAAESLQPAWVVHAPEHAPLCGFPTGSWLDNALPRTWHADLPCTWRVESVRSFVSCMANTTIAVIGDSMLRYTLWTYVAVLHRCGPKPVSPLFGPAPPGYAAECERILLCSSSHMDCSFRYEARGVFIQFHFLWMPFANDLTAHPMYDTLVRNAGVDTFVWLSIGLWTVKHERGGGKEYGENLQPGDISNPVNRALIAELVTNTTFANARMKEHLLWRSLPSVEHGDGYAPPGYTGDYIRERNYDLDQMWRVEGFPVQNVERYTYHPAGLSGLVHTWDATHSNEYVIAAITREAMSYFCGVRQRRLREAAAAAGTRTADSSTLQQVCDISNSVKSLGDVASGVLKHAEMWTAACTAAPAPPSCAPMPTVMPPCATGAVVHCATPACPSSTPAVAAAKAQDSTGTRVRGTSGALPMPSLTSTVPVTTFLLAAGAASITAVIAVLRGRAER